MIEGRRERVSYVNIQNAEYKSRASGMAHTRAAHILYSWAVQYHLQRYFRLEGRTIDPTRNQAMALGMGAAKGTSAMASIV
jgi:hypothetical protein